MRVEVLEVAGTGSTAMVVILEEAKRRQRGGEEEAKRRHTGREKANVLKSIEAVVASGITAY